MDISTYLTNPTSRVFGTVTIATVFSFLVSLFVESVPLLTTVMLSNATSVLIFLVATLVLGFVLVLGGRAISKGNILLTLGAFAFSVAITFSVVFAYFMSMTAAPIFASVAIFFAMLTLVAEKGEEEYYKSFKNYFVMGIAGMIAAIVLGNIFSYSIFITVVSVLFVLVFAFAAGFITTLKGKRLDGYEANAAGAIFGCFGVVFLFFVLMPGADAILPDIDS